jgi:class 3 adenylate cyclase
VEISIGLKKSYSKRQRDLLFNTLPAGVAERMLRGEDVSGDEFSSAAVMFCDIVGFTNESKKLSPRKVTQILEEIFEEFDAVCEKYQITKIKTIGDACLAVALEHESQTTVERIANAALKMSTYETKWPDGTPVVFRFGLHCRPVIAGVIGSQRFQYDILGDTVNFASRLENSCEPGRILISERLAKELPSSHADIQEGPILELKGLGEQKTYLLK